MMYQNQYWFVKIRVKDCIRKQSLAKVIMIAGVKSLF